MNSTSQDKIAWTVKEWRDATGLSHTTVYELFKTDTIESVKYGGKRLITTNPKAFIASLKQERAAA